MTGPARRQWLLRAAGLSAVIAWPRWAFAQGLKGDEHLLFVPGVARWLDDGQLEVDLHAWVYEHEPRRGMRTLFLRYLKLSRKEMSGDERQRFDQRSQLFLSDSERGKVLHLALDAVPGAVHTLPPTDASGRTQLRLLLPEAAVASVRANAPLTLSFRAGMAEDATRVVKGHALLVPAQGLSVISDIDDTIKITQVVERREMLLNTFVRPFEPAPGMATQFQRLASEPDTRFHYLSASPFQLAPALTDFLQQGGYPEGSLHLRESTRWTTLVPGSEDSRAHKHGVIARLLADFPGRRFLLIGDSGEADPDIYAEVARQHPARITGIVIRDVNNEGRDAARFQGSFSGLPAELWHLLPASGQPWPAL